MHFVLGKAANAKIFTENLLLLLNREDDPAEIIGPRHETAINSVHKLVLDVFSTEDVITHFYTNDLMVLIDIIARQLSDLGPGIQRYFKEFIVFLKQKTQNCHIFCFFSQICTSYHNKTYLPLLCFRYTYLEMAHLVLIRSEYNEHLHRLQDLKTCLNRIQLEDGDTVDKTKANEICETFSCFQNV